jgi:tetratricopeptide (TPR) repeat protein
LRGQIVQLLDQLQQYRRFCNLAEGALKEGIHAVHEKDVADDTAQKAEEALDIYGVLSDPNWQQTLQGPPLDPDQIVRIKNDVADLLVLLGMRRALYDTHDEASAKATRQALDLFDRAEKLRPPSIGVWMMRMLFHRRLGENSLADQAGVQAKESAQEGASTATDHYLLAAISLHMLKKPRDAVEQYRRALAIEPHNYGANWGFYLACKEINDVSGQLSSLAACRALRPEEKMPLLLIGALEFEIGRYAAAYTDLDECVRRNPEWSMAHYWLGRTSIMLSKWSEADRSLSRAIDIEQGQSPPEKRQMWTLALSWRAVVRGKQQRPEAAAADAAAALAHNRGKDFCWRAARTFALCARAVQDNTADGRSSAERYAARAVSLLREAAQKGFIKTARDLQSYRLSPDLAALRKREDFRRLLIELDSGLDSVPRNQ